MSRDRRALTVLVLLWAATSGPFLGKAFHIDDTVHVLQAEHIAADPAHPLDLEIFWFQWPERLSASNPITPPVWPYELAALVALSGGPREVVLNAWAALHVLLLGGSVYALGRGRLQQPGLAALLVVTSPAAVVGRNVMLDIPMLSYLCCGLALADAGIERNRAGWRAAGALIVGIASVTKLPGIVGAVALVGALLLARRPRLVPGVALAFAPLALWYLYQLAATGGIDILRARGGGGFAPEHSLVKSAEVALGHVVFWGGAVFSGHAFLAAAAASRTRAWPIALLPIATLLIGALDTGDLGAAVAGLGLAVAFVAGGLGLAVGAVLGARRLALAGGGCRRLSFLLGLWTLGQLAFDIAGLWEMNVRFAFLSAVPATLLCWAEIEALAARRRPRPVFCASRVALALGALLSLLVAWVDMQWANGYRRVAGEVAAVHAGTRVWFTGHWGFQHYAGAAGLLAYVPRDHALAAGDLLVVPSVAARQHLPGPVRTRLALLERHAIAPDLPLRTMGSGGGFYSTGWGPLPWGWSRAPAESIGVYRVSGSNFRRRDSGRLRPCMPPVRSGPRTRTTCSPSCSSRT